MVDRQAGRKTDRQTSYIEECFELKKKKKKKKKIHELNGNGYFRVNTDWSVWRVYFKNLNSFYFKI